MKTKNLIGPALDYAVAQIEGTLPTSFDNWEQTWPWYSVTPKADDIIDREMIGTHAQFDGQWIAHSVGNRICEYGPTRRIAAMRCYVANKLGDDVDIPAELA